MFGIKPNQGQILDAGSLHTLRTKNCKDFCPVVWHSTEQKFLKFMYSEKATKFWEIFILILTGTTQDKSKVKISQNFVDFSEYMIFKYFVHILGETMTS